jgi:quercetin dioxygenase-like cupin family protein
MQVIHARAEGATTRQRTETFTGTVLSDSVLPSTGDVVVNTVTFTPGARTHWHTHDRGQLLFVLAGTGFAALRGEPAQPIRAGDVVWFEPDEEHWHGAGPDSLLVHAAVSLGRTRWLTPVTDDEYIEHEEGSR